MTSLVRQEFPTYKWLQYLGRTIVTVHAVPVTFDPTSPSLKIPSRWPP